MDEVAKTLVTLGGLFALGLATHLLGRRTRLPRVTLLLLFGLGIGPAGPVLARYALVRVGEAQPRDRDAR